MSLDDARPGLEDDDVLLDELREATAAAAAVPDRAREAALAAFTWRTIDAELMALTYDSARDEEVLVRGNGHARVVGFSGQGMALEIELHAVRLTGQVLPRGVCTLTVHTPSGGEPVEVVTDESGFFQLDFDLSGLVRFDVEVDGEKQRTVWITV